MIIQYILKPKIQPYPELLSHNRNTQEKNWSTDFCVLAEDINQYSKEKVLTIVIVITSTTLQIYSR